jgi:hypothetical protein
MGITYEYNGDITTLFKTDLKYKDFPWNASLGNPRTVQFTDTSLGDPTAWYWDFGDGHYSQSQNPSHTYTGNIGTITFYSWKNAPVVLRSPAGWDGDRKHLILFPNDSDEEWDDAWTVMRNQSWGSNTQVCQRNATNPSALGEMWMSWSTVYYTMSSYPDPFLILLQNIGGINSFDMFNSGGCIDPAGLTVSMLDLGKDPLDQRRDFNITQLTAQDNTCLGAVENLNGERIYLHFHDDLDNPYRTFKEIFPTFVLNCWPGGAGTGVGYWGNCAQTFRLRPYTSDDWGKISIDFTDKSKLFDFFGTPRIGTAMLTVQFIDLSVLEVTEWDWDFGDGTEAGVTVGSTHQHPSHMYVYDSI